jgi:rhomboid protease GluP
MRQTVVTGQSGTNDGVDDPDAWFVRGPTGEVGPLPKTRLIQLIATGVIPPDTLVRNAYSNQQFRAGTFVERAIAPPVADQDDTASRHANGVEIHTAAFPIEAVGFQGFLGEADPVLQGKGSVSVADGVLTLRGRRRRLFALRKHDENIPLDKMKDVVADGRFLRFAVTDGGQSKPRLLRLHSAERAASLAACLPDRLSEAGRQQLADSRDFAAFLEASGPAFITLAIVVVNLAIFILGGFAGVGWMSGNAALLLDYGGNFAVATTDGQWWRLVSAMFLHSGLIHVAFNMWALWDAGRIAERLFGRWRYLALYTLAGLLGGIASINWQQDFVGVGASGAVFGVYGGLLAALLLRPELLPGTISKKLQTSATVFILYSLFNGFTHAGIDNAAHLGGLLAGGLVGAALVMPARRAFAAATSALILIGGGAVRAIEAAEPYRDELGFRQFLSSFAPAETRLNAIAADLGKRAKTLPPQEFLGVLEREVIPGWVEQDTRIAALRHVTPRNQPLRDDMARFVHLRRESWELLRDGIRRDDASGLEAFKKKSLEASAVLEQVKARVENAAPGKGGKAS